MTDQRPDPDKVDIVARALTNILMACMLGLMVTGIIVCTLYTLSLLVTDLFE